MGRDLEAMAEAAAIVEAAGADIVDVNLGCPTPRAVRGGVGATMLRDPDLLHRVLTAIRRRIRIPLSAKMRAGFDRDDRAPDIARRIEDAGVDFLVVHPRRRDDGFSGIADWRILRRIKEAVRVPVVGNGDCWYAADALRMTAETACDGVMIGRPALRNPWIFEQIEDLRGGRRPRRPSGEDLHLHLQEVVERFRPAFGNRESALLAKIKELLRFLARSLPEGQPFLRRALRLSTLDDLLRFAERTLRPLPPEGIDLGAHGDLAFERSGSTESWRRDDATW
jgi:tRNA-dihydrouridine synthase